MPTYPIDGLPRTPQTERLTLGFRQSAMQSPYTLATQVVNTASQWVLEWTWPRMTRVEAERCTAWLGSLQGQVGTFTYSPKQSEVSGLTNRSLAQIGNASATAVVIAGWAPGVASQLRAGQLCQIGNQLFQITSAPAQADGSGTCTVEFSTALRRQFSAGTHVEFVAPQGVFRLAASDGFGFTHDPDRLPEFGTYQAREAVE